MNFTLYSLSAGIRESTSYNVVYLVMAVLGPFFALVVGISFAVFMYRWMHKKRLRELNTNDEEYAHHAPHDLRAVPAGDSTLKVCFSFYIPFFALSQSRLCLHIFSAVDGQTLCIHVHADRPDCSALSMHIVLKMAFAWNTNKTILARNRTFSSFQLLRDLIFVKRKPPRSVTSGNPQTAFLTRSLQSHRPALLKTQTWPGLVRN